MQGAWVPSLVRKLRSQMLFGKKKKTKTKKNKPKVSEKDSNWLSSGHILLANGPENTAHELVQLEFMSPCLFFLQREKARIL